MKFVGKNNQVIHLFIACIHQSSIQLQIFMFVQGHNRTHLQDIIDIGFGRWSKVDPLLARTSCLAIERLSEDDKTKLLANSSV